VTFRSIGAVRDVPQAPSHARQERGDATTDKPPQDLPIPAPAAGELGLTRRERFVLLLGIHIACAVIAIVDRPTSSRCCARTAGAIDR
jgi:hypothetical protein